MYCNADYFEKEGEMIQTILILSLIITGFGIGGFFWIRGLYKKNRSLENVIEYQDTRIDLYQKNKKVYQAVLNKKMEGEKDAEKIKEKINNSNGSDLSDILNGL